MKEALKESLNGLDIQGFKDWLAAYSGWSVVMSHTVHYDDYVTDRFLVLKNEEGLWNRQAVVHWRVWPGDAVGVTSVKPSELHIAGSDNEVAELKELFDSE